MLEFESRTISCGVDILQRLIVVTDIHIKNNNCICSVTHSGLKGIINATKNSDNYSLSLSIRDDDDYDEYYSFNCNKIDFLSKLNALIDFLNDLSKSTIMLEDIKNIIPVEFN